VEQRHLGRLRAQHALHGEREPAQRVLVVGGGDEERVRGLRVPLREARGQPRRVGVDGPGEPVEQLGHPVVLGDARPGLRCRAAVGDTAAVVPDLDVLPRLPRGERTEVEPRGEGEQLPLRRPDPLSTVVDGQRARPDLGQCAPADPIGRLDHGEVLTHVVQPQRRRQPGVARANDNDIGLDEAVLALLPHGQQLEARLTQ